MPAPATPKQRALDYLRTVLDDASAPRADRQRAAEAILRADAPQAKGLSAAAALTDAELEAAARGEGGRPPERGPATGVTETGPIREGRFVAGGPTPSEISGKQGAPGAGPSPGGPKPRKGGPKPARPKIGPPPTGPDHDPLS